LCSAGCKVLAQGPQAGTSCTVGPAHWLVWQLGAPHLQWGCVRGVSYVGGGNLLAPNVPSLLLLQHWRCVVAGTGLLSRGAVCTYHSHISNLACADRGFALVILNSRCENQPCTRCSMGQRALSRVCTSVLREFSHGPVEYLCARLGGNARSV